jgi:hypothetical protein
MSVFKNRSRMVSIRLSEDEYIALRELCNSSGARSVSEVTRNAMHAFLAGSTKETVLHLRFSEVCDRMNHIGRRIDELVERLAPPEKEIEPEP